MFPGSAAASLYVSTTPECPSVESVLQFSASLSLPGLNGHSILLLNPVSVPFRDNVEAAEWYNPQIWCEVVYVASLQSLLVLVVLVLEVHHSEEHALQVELADGGVVVLDERVGEELGEAEALGLLLLVDEGRKLGEDLGGHHVSVGA